MKEEILEKKNYLLQSLFLHFLIILLIYYGLPNLFRYRSEFLPPLPVEIINISDKTAAPKINFKKSKEDTKNKTNYINQENKYSDQTEIPDDKIEPLETEEVQKVVKKKIVKLKELKKKPNQLQSVLKSIEEVKRDFGKKKEREKRK